MARGSFIPDGLTPTRFRRLARGYRKEWPTAVLWCDRDGRLIESLGAKTTLKPWLHKLRHACALAIAEAQRWGEPSVMPGPGESHLLLWACPLMINRRVTGGIVAVIQEAVLFPSGATPLGPAAVDLRAATAALRELLETENLTNGDYLALQRAEDLTQRQRAQAIHQLKRAPSHSLRQIYVDQEPALIAAVRRGDRGAARDCLNQILVALHQQAGERIDLIKSLFTELVASLCRTAVEAGGEATELLATNFAALNELSMIDDSEQAFRWLSRTLEQLLDAIEQRRRTSSDVLIADALRIMEQRYSEKLTRDDVAAAVHISPYHFSRLFKKVVGKGFGETLGDIRLRRALERLTQSEQPISIIAIECGYTDQSHLTKAVRKTTGHPPRRYRQLHQQRSS